jgi:hypothetical protein
VSRSERLRSVKASHTQTHSKSDCKNATAKTNARQETRENAMARTALTDLPTHNPCAQCGRTIALPEWVEETPGRVAYLWHCHACDYRFEAVAFFDDAADSEALAA